MVSVAGTTLSQLLVALSAALGPSTTFVTTQDAVNPNRVRAPNMIDTEAAPEKYGGSYLYCLADPTASALAGQQSRIQRAGFDPTSGDFVTAWSFTGNPLGGASWLLSGALPVLDADGLTGLRTCINRALRTLWTPIWHPITAVAGQDEYDLGALWFASRARFVRLMDPAPSGTGHPTPASQGWDVVQNGDVWTLQLGSGYPAGETFWLILDAPANYRLYLDGAWANQASPTAGLVLPADAALGEWNHLYQCALYECMQQLAVQAGGNRKAYWKARAAEQRAVVAAIKAYQLDGGERALGEGPSEAPGAWSGVWGDKGMWSL